MRIICLSNSFKAGGRCLAGIEINNDNKIGIYKRGPRWIRPVCKTDQEQVPNNISRNYKYYDLIEFNSDPSYKRTDYQSENLLIRDNKLKYIGKVNISGPLSDLCNNNTDKNIFGNISNFVSKIEVNSLKYSLMMIEINKFEVVTVDRYGSTSPQRRLKFSYHNTIYDLPITDPIFLQNYEHDNDILRNLNNLFIILSLGVEFNSKYYKLVATLLY